MAKIMLFLALTLIGFEAHSISVIPMCPACDIVIPPPPLPLPPPDEA